jgi:GTP-binding protein
MTAMPRVALIGRPNVGKSTLFNRLLKKRVAVVADVAGTTRDRLEQPLQWSGKQFIIVDMAGLEPTLAEPSEIRQGTQLQIERALQEASVIIWVVDGVLGIQAQDQQIAVLLRSLHKPVIIAVNKLDHPKHEVAQYEFAQFGFEGIAGISAVHDRGMGDLLDQVTAQLPSQEAGITIKDEKELRISIVGRPNVGKSTLLNTLVQEERSVVSAVAGTTRDSVDTVIPVDELFPKTYTKWRQIRFIDTAGIRRRGKIGHSVEAWSVVRSFDAIDLSEVVLFMIDGTEGLVHQDLQVSDKIIDSGRAAVLLINKWDLVLKEKEIFPGTPEEQALQEKILATLLHQAPFLHWVQVLFLSAQEKINVQMIGKVVLKAYNSWNLKVSEEDLKDFSEQLHRHPRFKNLLHVSYEHACPPVFHVHVEGKALPHFSDIRMIENSLRQYFDIGSTPIKVWVVPSVDRRH